MAVIRYIGKQKDERALNTEREYIKLVAQLRETLYRLARSIVTDDAEAEDIVQDALERGWRLRDAVMESEHPRAYICRIAHNLAVDRVRHKSRERAFEISGDSERHSDGERSIDIGNIASLTMALINTLPDKQRITIHMRDVEGYELSEIADIIDSDEASVRMNLSRARKRIREELTKIMNYGVQ